MPRWRSRWQEKTVSGYTLFVEGSLPHCKYTHSQHFLQNFHTSYFFFLPLSPLFIFLQPISLPLLFPFSSPLSLSLPLLLTSLPTSSPHLSPMCYIQSRTCTTMSSPRMVWWPTTMGSSSTKWSAHSVMQGAAPPLVPALNTSVFISLTEHQGPHGGGED